MFTFVACCACSVAQADDLYNNLGDTNAPSYYADWDGGSGDIGGGTSYGLQTGQVFSSSITGSLTSVEGIFENASATPQLQGALVQLFNFSGGVVGTEVGEQNVAGSITDLGPSRYFNNRFESDVRADVSIAGLVAGQEYLAVIQPHGINWGWLEDNNDGNHHTFCRDFSLYGSQPGFGTTTWRESGTFSGFFSGDSVMRIQGTPVPEPGSLAVLVLGCIAVLRRRR
ncbi:MAG TPA: PEP-CTERM sorting domain-containing protein [Fimbriimonadaceae bacterium]|nr:PEP-CTERM sorting domain-containing protein [Fimbriimonadaceae bacterium]